jgi:hypothetical protein
MRRYIGPIIVVLIIIVMSVVFLSVVMPHDESQATDTSSVNNNVNLPHSVVITPSTKAGEGIHTITDNNKEYVASLVNSGDGQTYYFTNRSTILHYYKVVDGNYTAPFNCTFVNGTVDGVENARIITDVN